MDDTPAKSTPGENFNKIDLSAFEAFQFGTQWSTDKGGPGGAGDSGGGERTRHGPGGDSGPSRRDRRPPRRDDERGGPPRREGGPEQRSFDRSPPRDRPAPRPDDRGAAGPGGPGRFDRPRRFERSEGPRGDWQSRGDGPRGGGMRDQGPRRPAGPPRPYLSPVFEATFYPDDQGFNALVKAMRASCRTYELFEIARLILGKIERCVVVFKRRTTEAGQTPPLFISVPDGVPFETEDEAISHALEHNLASFFSTETVEVEPPKGSFQFVNRCPITKDLLGPPNYHRYAQILQHHYAARGIHLPFERYKASIEVVRDPEAVNAWLESMKKVTRYTYRGEIAGESGVFDNLEDARSFLLRTCRDRLVRQADTARVAAKVVEAAGRSEAAQAMHGALDAQRRFPLDTANALRGRIRRENFHIFKRGSKGITYVCSVRRKFRQPGQVFSESINRLIEFLDKNPMLGIASLPQLFLGFAPPSPAAAPAPASPPAAAATEGPAEAAAAQASPAVSAEHTEAALSNEQRLALNRLMLDLRWLVSEGYVAEYSDGKLFAHPVLVQGQTEPDERDHEGHVMGDAVEGSPAGEVVAAEPVHETPPMPAAAPEPSGSAEGPSESLPEASGVESFPAVTASEALAGPIASEPAGAADETVTPAGAMPADEPSEVPAAPVPDASDAAVVPAPTAQEAPESGEAAVDTSRQQSSPPAPA